MRTVRPEEAASFQQPSRRTPAGHIATETWNHSTSALALPLGLDPLRVRRAAQSALACVLALILVLIYRLPHGYWALVSIVVLTQPNVGASVSKGVLRLIGTLAGAVLGVILLQLVQQPVPFLLLLSVVITTTAYWGAGSVAPYAFAMLGITAIIVAMSGFLDPTLGVSIAVQRSAEVALGIVIAPNKPAPRVARTSSIASTACG